ncbi:caffeic acid 3-O-methyltransferase-like protein [Trifolium pratense]|uniref:Caffeic acid 3-O-methyltransferase-like protein n=1 Tax=Trifolium pratense TaxID=57577 RepID=A0A2K3MZH0_TRIPR|nr:caffeic acid 3-O-methyltransferase-like protein [Trifolium pratense]
MENDKVAVIKSQSKARLAILELAHMMSVPMSLIAVLNMKVPDAIWQGGHNTPLSASQILSVVRPNGAGDAENLQRILRLLTTYDIFAEHLSSNGERKYSLTDVVPFNREMLESYDGFKGVETLVDVGGNSGVTLNMIMQKYPNILKGINYDFPDMISSAPQYPRITHVGGDALESVPAGDAIFMKWIFLTWTDEECKKALQNCYKAIPVDGKLIVCEPVLPELTDESQRTRALLGGDIYIMTLYRPKGKHRTEEQFKQLGISTDPVHVVQVEDVHTTDLSETPPPSGCGMSFSQVIVTDEVLNLNVAHDLAILQQYWKESSDIGHRVYTDEEERAATINFLKNSEAAKEEPFTDVVSKTKKK